MSTDVKNILRQSNFVGTIVTNFKQQWNDVWTHRQMSLQTDTRTDVAATATSFAQIFLRMLLSNAISGCDDDDGLASGRQASRNTRNEMIKNSAAKQHSRWERIYIYTMGRSNLRAIPVQTFKKEQQASSVCRCVCMAAEARAMVGVNKAVRKAGLWDAFRTSLPAKNGSRKLGNIRLCGGRERLSSIPTSWIPFTYQQQRIRQKKEKNSKLCQGFPKYRCLSLDAEEEAKRYMYSKCVRGKHLAMTQLEHFLSFSLVLLWFKFLFVTSVP